MIEIERKFLVESVFPLTNLEKVSILDIRQGYLSDVPERTVRVRTDGTKGFITIKGKGNDSGTTRLEIETEIPLIEASALIDNLCLPGIISKTRIVTEYKGHTWEIDVFSGKNLGLMIAEIELQSEGEVFEVPPWVGKEVTGNKKYYNSSLRWVIILKNIPLKKGIRYM